MCAFLDGIPIGALLQERVLILLLIKFYGKRVEFGAWHDGGAAGSKVDSPAGEAARC